MEMQVQPYVLSTADEHALVPEKSFKECAQDCPEMIVVPGGSFTMGSPAGKWIVAWAREPYRPRTTQKSHRCGYGRSTIFAGRGVVSVEIA